MMKLSEPQRGESNSLRVRSCFVRPAATHALDTILPDLSDDKLDLELYRINLKYAPNCRKPLCTVCRSAIGASTKRARRANFEPRDYRHCARLLSQLYTVERTRNVEGTREPCGAPESDAPILARHKLQAVEREDHRDGSVRTPTLGSSRGAAFVRRFARRKL